MICFNTYENRENYGKILEAADAVDLMHQHAKKIYECLENVEVDAENTEVVIDDESPREQSASDGEKLVERFMECPVEAWNIFREGEMVKAAMMCHDTINILAKEENKILEKISRSLFNCTALQIKNTASLIKRAASDVITSMDPSFNYTDQEKFHQALLVFSGLATKSDYSQEDVLEVFLGAWKSIEFPKNFSGGEGATRMMANKHLQMMRSGRELFGEKQEFGAIFEVKMAEIMNSDNIPVIYKTLVDDGEEVSRKVALGAIQRWLDSTWSSPSLLPTANLRLFHLIQKYQAAFPADQLSSVPIFACTLQSAISIL